jgi:hypothetical protein
VEEVKDCLADTMIEEYLTTLVGFCHLILIEDITRLHKKLLTQILTIMA